MSRDASSFLISARQSGVLIAGSLRYDPPKINLTMSAGRMLHDIDDIITAIKPAVTRVEFIRNESLEYHRFGGALLYSPNALLARIENALLGNGGPGPLLSQRILELLDAPAHLFRTINEDTVINHERYGIVVDIKK